MVEGGWSRFLQDLLMFSGQEGRGCPERVRGRSDGKGPLGVGNSGRFGGAAVTRTGPERRVGAAQKSCGS